MALMLVIAGFSNDDKLIEKTLNKIDYYLRRNAISYASHSKKKEQMRKIE